MSYRCKYLLSPLAIGSRRAGAQEIRLNGAELMGDEEGS